MKLQNDFSAALLKEIASRKDYIGDEVVRTIYFGGGTPSLLPDENLERILTELNKQFTVAADAEFTFEANPDDITELKLESWVKLGINRLSIGIQSFFEDDLKWMNRAHDANQAIQCISKAQEAGINNMSIDLIYGTPTLSDAHWLTNLETAVKLGIPHLSCYALTVEPGTALEVMTKKNKVVAVNTEDQARQFLMMTDFLKLRGYEHYEISNFALPGKRSIHNSSYWNGEKYLGLGPSAHSFNGHSRQWNVANNSLYIQSIANNSLSFEMETLTDSQRLNEYIMTSLRKIEGTDLNFIASSFGKNIEERILRDVSKYEGKGWVEINSGKICLTREGKLFADGIASDLFEVN